MADLETQVVVVGGGATGTAVLRVHLDSAADASAVPAEIAGIPVQLLRGSYRPEAPDSG